jgi:two-component system, LytTR family, sensor kinase
VAGFNTAIAMTNKWVAEEQARKEAEKEHIRSELAFLQNQISPHFFMNTLNNIHSLVDSDHALAQNAILKLSALMRYLLYESGRGTTTLKKEIDFIRSYVSLMQLRVNESVTISLDMPEKVNDVSLPPLLFISFIENAFKHGISSRGKAHLAFSLARTGDKIEFTSINSVPEYLSEEETLKGGIGLENIRKRLVLLYGSSYSLDIDQTGNEFSVRLVIPV